MGYVLTGGPGYASFEAAFAENQQEPRGCITSRLTASHRTPALTNPQPNDWTPLRGVTDGEFAGAYDTAPDAQPVARTRKQARPAIIGFFFYLALIVFIAVVYLSTTMGSSAPRNLFGYSAMTVLTGSMQNAIPQGSLIVTKQVDPASIQIGDDITFLVDATTTVTHRVVGIYENHENSGQRGFQTQGVNNLNPDKDVVMPTNVVGKVIFHSEALGKALRLIKDLAVYLVVSVALLVGVVVALRVFFAPGRGRGRKAGQGSAGGNSLRFNRQGKFRCAYDGDKRTAIKNPVQREPCLCAGQRRIEANKPIK